MLSSREAEEVADSLDRIRGKHLSLPVTTKIQVRDAIKNSALREPRGPFTDAAKALVKYVREVFTPARISGPSEAEIAMDAAVRYAFPAVGAYPAIDRSEAALAISDFTRAIQLSGNNTTLKSDALLSRGTLYALLSDPDAALADAEASEMLGEADLSDIISIERFALVRSSKTRGP
jgi:hypothetical protein